MPNPSRPFYEEGPYTAEVVSQALSKASTGTPSFVLRFKVLGKTDPLNPQSYIPVQSYERTMYRYITSKTIEIVLEDLQQLGYRHNEFGPLDPSHPNHQSFAGNQIDVFCKHEPDLQGVIRERWQLSRPLLATKMDVEALDQKSVRELNQLLGKHLRTASAGNGGTRQPAKPETRETTRMEITDEDIPFSLVSAVNRRSPSDGGDQSFSGLCNANNAKGAERCLISPPTTGTRRWQMDT